LLLRIALAAVTIALVAAVFAAPGVCEDYLEKVLGDVSEMAICGKKFRKVTALVFEPS